jgi:hypothetical protein
MNVMFSRGAVLALTAILILLAPAGATLELHHLLGATDSDGHQHSDFDLCQWVQAHIGSSMVDSGPILCSCLSFKPYEPTVSTFLLSALLSLTAPSRAPPVS